MFKGFVKKTAETSWLAKAVVGSVISGYTISEFVLTEERLDTLKRKMSDNGFSIFSKAHAFSTPDHGLHSPHYPWEFNKLYRTFDHAAYHNF